MNVGFIGLGRMGQGMARRILGGGHDLVVYNRTREKALDLAAAGARVATSIAEVCAGREVVIVDYDPRWPQLFAAERARLEGLLGDAVAGIHHVGSTSVVGLATKPIIDVLIFLHRFLTETEIGRCGAGLRVP